MPVTRKRTYDPPRTLSAKCLIKPALIFFIFASVTSTRFASRFSVIIDSEMIRNYAETDQPEAEHLITGAFVLHMILYGLLPLLIIAWVKIVHGPIFQKAAVNLAIIVPCLVGFRLASLSHSCT